jgi:hypothetical protein
LRKRVLFGNVELAGQSSGGTTMILVRLFTKDGIVAYGDSLEDRLTPTPVKMVKKIPATLQPLSARLLYFRRKSWKKLSALRNLQILFHFGIIY